MASTFTASMHRAGNSLVCFAARIAVGVSFALCMTLVSPVFSQPTSNSDQALQEIAAAFAQKDIAAVGKLVDDGWSGLRFCANWSDDQWQSAARALRNATIQSNQAEVSVYRATIRWSYTPTEDTKLITMNLRESGWKLDLNSFLGPFPHL